MFLLQNELFEFNYLTLKLNTFKKKHTTIDEFFKRSIINKEIEQQTNKFDIND